MLIIDIYTAEVLDRLQDYPRIPKASWGGIRVSLPGTIAKRLIEVGREDIIQKHRGDIIRWPKIDERREQSVVLIRGSMIGPVKRYLNLKDAVWIYSMWPGYLERSELLDRLEKFLDDLGVPTRYLHTSGHAKLFDLKRLVQALRPKTIIPVHTDHPEIFKDHFQNIRLASDGEIIEI